MAYPQAHVAGALLSLPPAAPGSLLLQSLCAAGRSRRALLDPLEQHAGIGSLCSKRCPREEAGKVLSARLLAQVLHQLLFAVLPPVSKLLSQVQLFDARCCVPPGHQHARHLRQRIKNKHGFYQPLAVPRSPQHQRSRTAGSMLRARTLAIDGIQDVCNPRHCCYVFSLLHPDSDLPATSAPAVHKQSSYKLEVPFQNSGSYLDRWSKPKVAR